MASDQLLPLPVSESNDFPDDIPQRESAFLTASKHVVSHEFSIDELREIAYHFGVPHLAQITEREALVESIRRRI